MKSPADTYIEEIDGRMQLAEIHPYAGDVSQLIADRVYHQRAVQLTKFGLIDTFCFVVYVPEADAVGPDWVRRYSQDCFAFALARKSWMPRGFFGGLEVFPLIIVDRVRDDLRDFVLDEYTPKHWAAFEFPSVMNLEFGKLLYYRHTPAWGALYFEGFRERAKQYFEG